jgi:hypothetical protein
MSEREQEYAMTTMDSVSVLLALVGRTVRSLVSTTPPRA